MNLLKRIQNQVDNLLDGFVHYYVSSIVVLHVLYVLAFIGILSFNGALLRIFSILIQIFICGFLMFRFHPFRKHHLREHDAKIIFSSAAFLLFNMVFVEVFHNTINDTAEKTFQKFTSNFQGESQKN